MERKFEWLIPTEREDEFKELIGCKIVSIMKFSYETFKDYLDYLDYVEQNGYRDRISFFKYSYGCLLLVFVSLIGKVTFQLKN